MATLNDVLLELVSAQSALNMPDPASCSKEFVVHAYEHIGKAIELLSSAVNVSSEEHPDIYYDSTTGSFHVDVDRILIEGGYDIRPTTVIITRRLFAKQVEELANAWVGLPFKAEYHFERSFRECVLRYAAELGFPRSHK